MKRWWPLWVVLVVGGGSLGGWTYFTHRQVQQVGLAMHKEIEGDFLPLQPGVLDDPAFKNLPPPATPPSLGRYLPPKPAPAPAASTDTPKAATPATRPDASATTVEPAPPSTPTTSDASPSSNTSPITASPPHSTATPTSSPASTPRSGPFVYDSSSPSVPLSQQKVHILLIGNDQPELGSGRGDILLTLTFDPAAQTLYLLSVPRDTRVNLPGHGLVKINAAYAYGGASLQTTAVERFLGIPFDKYVEVSLNGFTRAIDEVGGVNVNSAFRFDLDGQHIEPGPMHLTGPQALVYARMRHDDPEGDLGRNRRQQEVVRALMKSLGQLKPAALNEVLGHLSQDVRTDFSPSEIVRLREAHPYILTHQKSLSVQGQNRKIGGIWYYLVSDRERQRLHLLLR